MATVLSRQKIATYPNGSRTAEWEENGKSFKFYSTSYRNDSLEAEDWLFHIETQTEKHSFGIRREKSTGELVCPPRAGSEITDPDGLHSHNFTIEFGEDVQISTFKRTSSFLKKNLAEVTAETTLQFSPPQDPRDYMVTVPK